MGKVYLVIVLIVIAVGFGLFLNYRLGNAGDAQHYNLAKQECGHNPYSVQQVGILWSRTYVLVTAYQPAQANLFDQFGYYCSLKAAQTAGIHITEVDGKPVQ